MPALATALHEVRQSMRAVSTAWSRFLDEGDPQECLRTARCMRVFMETITQHHELMMQYLPVSSFALLGECRDALQRYSRQLSDFQDTVTDEGHSDPEQAQHCALAWMAVQEAFGELLAELDDAPTT